MLFKRNIFIVTDHNPDPILIKSERTKFKVYGKRLFTSAVAMK